MKRSFAKMRPMIPVLFKIRREHERGRTGGTSQLCALGGPFCDLLSRPLTDPVLSVFCHTADLASMDILFFFFFDSISPTFLYVSGDVRLPIPDFMIAPLAKRSTSARCT